MKSILAVAEDPGSFGSVLSTALLAARQFGSYVEGMAICDIAVPFGVADGLSGTMTSALETIEAESRARAEQLRELFESFMRQEEVILAQTLEEPTLSMLSGLQRKPC